MHDHAYAISPVICLPLMIILLVIRFSKRYIRFAKPEQYNDADPLLHNIPKSNKQIEP